MYNNGAKLGTRRVTAGFPTPTVQAKILEDLNQFWVPEKINDMYLAYKEAVLDKGLASYPGKDGEVVDYIIKNTIYSLNDVRIFLVSLIELVNANEIDEQYLKIELQKGSLTDRIENTLPDPNEAFFKNLITAVKWVAILGAVGIGLYLVGPVLKLAKNN